MEQIYKVDIEKVKLVKWKGDPFLYDTELSNLGPQDQSFFVANPEIEDSESIYIEDVPNINKCIVFFSQGQWVVKYFPVGWSVADGYQEVEIDLESLPIGTSDPFYYWSDGFKEAIKIKLQLELNPNDAELNKRLYVICSKKNNKDKSQYRMHGALDGILYHKKLKLKINNWNNELTEKKLRKIFKTSGERLS